MKTITRKSELAMMRNQYERYEVSDNYYLWDVYNSYSRHKENAYEYCENLMHDLEGWGLKIIGANSTQFSVGFEYPNKETGEIMFAYITKDYDRTCSLSF